MRCLTLSILFVKLPIVLASELNVDNEEPSHRQRESPFLVRNSNEHEQTCEQQTRTNEPQDHVQSQCSPLVHSTAWEDNASPDGVEMPEMSNMTKKTMSVAPWKKSLLQHRGYLTRAGENYASETHCCIEKARGHLSLVASESLAWQLLDPDQEKRKEAANTIKNTVASVYRLSKHSTGTKLLEGSHTKAIKAYMSATGQKRTSAFRYFQKHLTKEIADLIKEETTFDEGMQMLLQPCVQKAKEEAEKRARLALPKDICRPS